ncbi:hypothetical protein L1049_013292 [Liquidambar formosana]|uniref:Uncharacterized protein n=1 Tax=Liquidambar formosana TaxID=63359 RepID=A0AAP0RLN7_LIQFO
MFLPLLLICTLCLPRLIRAQSSPGISARSLDALLQDYAFKAFVLPRTGIPYDGGVPSNLTGIKVSAMRLRSGSLRTRGVHGYKEFQIPTGVAEQPYVERLVLVYHNLANWSSFYYPLPPGFSYLAPVLGLLAYDASNLSATNLPELDIRASGEPISINFLNVKLAPNGSSPKCVNFDLHGMVEFNNVLPGNVCSTIHQGHFSIVVQSIPTGRDDGAPPVGGGSGDGGKGKSKVWTIGAPVISVFVFLLLLGLLVVWVKDHKQGRKMQGMESAAEEGDALRMTAIGDTKAPVAMRTRTQPVLENDYVP